jgi:hypothetical protein
MQSAEDSGQTPEDETVRRINLNPPCSLCPERDLNPHEACASQDFKSCASTNSAIRANCASKLTKPTAIRLNLVCLPIPCPPKCNAGGRHPGRKRVMMAECRIWKYRMFETCSGNLVKFRREGKNKKIPSRLDDSYFDRLVDLNEVAK